jgi:hypothetical protein
VVNYKGFMGHASFRCANGFHTPVVSPVIVFVLGLDFDFSASLSDRVLSFLPPPLEETRPFLLTPCTRPSTSASSAAALSSPRSARPSKRRAARATRYRVLARAGAGVRLGRLRVGEDNGGEEDWDWEVLSRACGAEEGRESEAALLVLPLVLAT